MSVTEWVLVSTDFVASGKLIVYFGDTAISFFLSESTFLSSCVSAEQTNSFTAK